MLTLTEAQLKKLDELLDVIPHGYAKRVIMLIHSFHTENQAKANGTQAPAEAEVPVLEVVE